MSNRFDVVAMGELVVDLVPTCADSPSMQFVAHPGGAPGNVAMQAARLGLRSAMLSMVGDEPFGASIVALLSASGVDTSGIRLSHDHPTGLAVVTIDAGGERNFIFYRNGCADLSYGFDDVVTEIVAATRVFHIGSLFLAHETSAAAQRRALCIARRSHALISADPNFRTALWSNLAAMKAAGHEVIRSAQIVKLSSDELFLLTGLARTEIAVRSLWHRDMMLIAVTNGAHGAEVFTLDHVVSVPGFSVKAVDTVGCGDAFMGALLVELAVGGFNVGQPDELRRLTRWACAAGALTATKPGAMASLPTKMEISAFLSSHPHV
jgi:fructokinase